ncbi:MAG: hypothetical protein JRI23_24225 [Deltaproteobacteria bacterium]|nr:hypothetical protein [Deltaproteobacteria bacterium]MBW2535105.1 hypothetical protein [Deltaproteobacteria bacterium]
MSKRASEQLQGRRVLRLLEIELDENTPLARGATGPLGGDLIRVWIDTPSAKVVHIEVRRTGRAVARRRLAVGRFEPDIAARVVAIAASEMVHAHARPPRSKPPEKTRPDLGAAQQEEAFRTAFAASSSMHALWLPASDPDLALGPELALTHRRGPTGQVLYARWLVNGYAEHRLRWFEVGAGADLRIVLPEPTWRIHLGARAGAVALGLPQAATIDGESSAPHAWSARAGALAGIEARLPDAGWLELSVEPGAVLRSLEATDHQGVSQSIGGFALGASLALHVEVPPPQQREPSGKSAAR